ncbi:MAG: hypothetical protein WCH52_02280, partial [Bacteroidota bacterium]
MLSSKSTKFFLATALVLLTSIASIAQQRSTNSTQSLSNSCTLGSITPGSASICAGNSVTLNAVPASFYSCFENRIKHVDNLSYQYSSVTKDAENNIYFSGHFNSRTITIGQQTINNTNGGRDFFIVKYDSCGKQVWAISGGSSGDVQLGNIGGKGIAADAQGNLYVVGRYTQNCTIYGSNNTSFLSPYTINANDANAQDGFLVKLNPSGNVLWGATITGGSNDGFNGVTVGPDGNPIVTSVFNSNPITGNATLITNSINLATLSPGATNNATAAVIKFSNGGNVLWKTFIYNKEAAASGLTTDAAANVYVTGWFNSSVSGTPATVVDASAATNTISNAGDGAAYLIKLTSAGNWAWGNEISNGGSGGNTLAYGSDVAVDAGGNPWLTGYYSGFAILGLSSSLSNSGFIARYNSAGSLLLAKKLSIPSNDDAKLFGIAINNNVVGLAGNTKNGANDLLFATYQIGGAAPDEIIVRQSGGASGDDFAYGITSFRYGFLVAGANSAGTQLADSTLAAGSFLYNTTSPDGSGNLVPSFTWGNGSTSPILTVSPAQDTTVTGTFTDGISSCTVDVLITVNPILTPIFDIPVPTNICSRVSPYTLPNPNNLTGAWSPSSLVDHSDNYTFIPDDGQCAVSATFHIDYLQAICLIITQVQPICRSSISFELDPYQFDCNGNQIHGTWTPAMVNNLITTTYHFVPDPEFCVEEGDMIIEVRSLYAEFNDFQTVYCTGSAVDILPTVDTNGVHGTWSPATISNTSSGTYIFTPYQFWPLGSTIPQCPYGHPYTLNVTILQGTHNTLDITACESYTWSCNGASYSQSGNYICEYTNTDGCASVDTLH